MRWRPVAEVGNLCGQKLSTFGDGELVDVIDRSDPSTLLRAGGTPQGRYFGNRVQLRVCQARLPFISCQSAHPIMPFNEPSHLTLREAHDGRKSCKAGEPGLSEAKS
jgi:hypothetical protein